MTLRRVLGSALLPSLLGLPPLAHAQHPAWDFPIATPAFAVFRSQPRSALSRPINGLAGGQVRRCDPSPSRWLQMSVGAVVGAGFGYVMYYAAGGILSDQRELDAESRRIRTRFVITFAAIGTVGMAVAPRRVCQQDPIAKAGA